MLFEKKLRTGLDKCLKKGEIVRDTGKLLEKKGYEIRVLDLISMERSHCYNPFVYLQNDNDIQRLVTNLFKATTPKGSQTQDPFWDTAASMLLLALVFYLHYEAPDEEQNFAMVMEMLRAGAIEDEEDPRPSPLDNLFSDLELDNPDHIALKYYHSYHAGSVPEMRAMLGIGKTESYWLLKKKYFETVIVFGKIRVLVDSFEAWYANQTWYKKVDGTPPGQNLTHTISIQEAADALGVRTSTVYELLKRYPITVYQIGRHRRIDKVSFEKWRAENPRYRPQNEGSDCIGSE